MNLPIMTFSNTSLLNRAKWFTQMSLAILLAACSTPEKSRYSQKQDSAPQQQVDVTLIPDAIPVKTTRSKYGNPDSYEVFGKRYYTRKTSVGYREKGIASWYGTKFHGHRTSSGEAYDMYAMTAAHKTLPLPTYARVTNLDNDRSVIVKINDRGPFHAGRIVDLSYAAAIKLGINTAGTGQVEVVTLEAQNSTSTAVSPSVPVQPVAAAHLIEKPLPSTPLKNAQIYLQLGAFTERKNAEKLQRQLIQSNFEGIHIIPARASSQEIYRVRIGPLQDTQTADTLAGMLKQHGIDTPSIVTD
ncbi:MAG: septal ring lytic transglycosylase RlpA family protein [Gammaproteobacteria bacterium]